MLCAHASRRSFFNPNKWDIREQELVDDHHGQAPIFDRLDRRCVLWHGVNDKTVNGGAPDDALIAFPTLQEQ
jgi:hypothetical protein